MIKSRTQFASLLVALTLFVMAKSAYATPAELAPLLKENCHLCHSEALQTGGLNLAGLIDELPLVKNRETWNRVIGALEVGKMPPPGAPQPSAEMRTQMLALLRKNIDDFDYSTIDPDPGFELMRRLTHTQYDNTVRDLFGFELRVTDRFPTELTGSTGFENSSNTLFLQSSLMERYIAAAQRIVEIALPTEPSTRAHHTARDLVFIDTPGTRSAGPAAATAVLEHFMQRAYRRPVTADETGRAVEQYLAARDAGLPHEQAIKQVLQTVLISPKFLLRVEAGTDATAPFKITDWELASRLSYFMWSTMPDQELFDLAAQGRLSDPDVLRAQVTRMLGHDRANTLGDVFAAQWLGFHNVGTRIWLDPIDFPWCTASLMTAMRDETSLFFMSLLRDNQPAHMLIDADYTFVNGELATTLYEMEGVEGPHMRRVSLDDPNRGGVISQPSILALTSNYSDTSPVKRGKYVLDTLLGTPPPEPPPNAAVLSQEVAEMRNLSFREKVETHSENEYCRGCHSRIDPIGFSLENFDFFGRWRDTYEFRERVDTAEEADETIEFETETSAKPTTIHFKYTSRPIPVQGALPDGLTFDGPAGLKRALLRNRHDDLVRQVASKMLSYALGRQLEYSDEPALRQIIEGMADHEYRLQILLQEVVASFPFQYKRNP
jgi:hypothetical protein